MAIEALLVSDANIAEVLERALQKQRDMREERQIEDHNWPSSWY